LFSAFFSAKAPRFILPQDYYHREKIVNRINIANGVNTEKHGDTRA
jgi:hypothetical protein